MPIQFNCENCGHGLTVSDKLAGKSGKCPKCQNPMVVPTQGSATGAKVGDSPLAGNAGTPKRQKTAPENGSSNAVANSRNPSKSDSTTGKGSPSKASQKSTSAGVVAIDPNRMGALLDEMGFTKKTGPTCPSCGSNIRSGTVVCTSCGFNLQTEKKVTGYAAKIERPEFDNLYLQQAVDNMQRDHMTDQRREKSAMPWWVLASFLIGVIVLCGAGVILVDANFGEPAPAETRLGRIQRIPVLVILGTTFGVTGLALALFAHLNICVFGFQRKVLLGFACFVLPLLFSLPYGIVNWTDNKAPIKGFMMALVFIGAGVGLILSGGGFGKLNGVL